MKSLLKNGKLLLAVIIFHFLFNADYVPAQTKTFSPGSNNNWSTASNWSPSGVPTSSNNVVIPGGRTCNIDANASCASITFGTGSAKRLTIEGWGTTLTIAGNMTVNDSATLSPGFLSGIVINGTTVINGTLVYSPGFWGSIEFRNGINNNGTFSSSGTGIYNFTTNNQSINGNPVTFSTGTWGSMTVGGSISLTNNTTLTVTGNLDGENTNSKFINAANSALNISGTLMSTGFLDAVAQGNTVNYNGTNQTIKDTSYFNLTTSGSGNKTLAASAVPFDISGNLTIGNGTTFNSNARNINLKGSWINNGSFTNPGTITFNGNAAQSIGGSSPAAFNNLTIDNASGITLLSDQTIGGSLNFAAGNLYTGSNNLNLGTNGSVTGEGEGHYLVGSLTVSRVAGTGTIDNLGGTGFSILNSGDDLGTVSVTRLSGPDAVVYAGGSEGIYRRWIISATNQPVSGRMISFNWVADDDNGIDLGQALVFRSPDGNEPWLPVGLAQDVSADRTIEVNTTAFSTWTVSDASRPLPVELVSFKAAAQGKNVVLNWRTETEVQNYGFEIQKSEKNSTEWRKIGFISGSGNSNAPKDYSFTENDSKTGTFVYRLKQIDNDGSFEFSSEVEVEIDQIVTEFALEQNYPNPFNPVTRISYRVPENSNSKVELKIFDVLGNEVATLVNETQQSGEYTVEFNAASLTSGVYVYKLQAGNYSSIKKMVYLR